ncbi:MAG: substrate-binding domain-containing protein [Clostridia bacterium]|nr:substrate-binding domain-containing protein [Clostridia bacterium]
MKLSSVKNIIKDDILNNRLGSSGERFFTANEIIEKYDVSFTSALKLLNDLTEENFLLAIGNKKYVMNGIMSPNSNLHQHLKGSKKIGVLLQSITNPYFSKVTEALNTAILKKGYTPVLKISSADNEISTLISFVQEGCVGVISFFKNKNTEIIDIYNRLPIPCVFISSSVPIENACCVHSDNYSAGKQAAKHLLEFGYEKLFLCGITKAPSLRFSGFIDYLKSKEIQFSDEQFLLYNMVDTFANSHILAEIKKSAPQRVGIFCYHDLIAENIFNLLRHNNIAVPNQVGLIGYDQLDTVIPISSNLTTFYYSFTDIANSAINLLINNIKTLKPVKTTIKEKTVLYIRSTTSKV